MEKGFTRQNIQFQNVNNIPGQLYNAIAVSNNRMVYRIDNIENKHTQAPSDYNLNQIKFLNSGKYFFAGVGHEGKPGSLQIWKQ